MTAIAAPQPEISGVLIIDKPAGITSHDVVARVRKILHQRQVGHFGTLDPFATGVLPVSVGKATRFAQFYLKSRKAYEGAIRFGFATDTYDATGEPTTEAVPVALEASVLEGHLPQFTGRLLQTPPPYSAKRVGGVRAYELARQHKPVNLTPVEVEIYALELLGLEGEQVRFAVECSGGTYVRSLAHDLGQKLGCGAHLAGLRRTSVAEFALPRAVTLERLQEAVQQGNLDSCIVRLEALLPDCPELLVRGREEASVRHGQTFELAQALRPGRGEAPGHAPAVNLLKILGSERRLIAVARHVSGAIYHPHLVLV
ncbi:MAG: tRNA pseudouridine(55) synthase TruB [Terriglobia bacterium]|jgi:tRNA pseudouridine55 synthase